MTNPQPEALLPKPDVHRDQASEASGLLLQGAVSFPFRKFLGGLHISRLKLTEKA